MKEYYTGDRIAELERAKVILGEDVVVRDLCYGIDNHSNNSFHVLVIRALILIIEMLADIRRRVARIPA